MAENVRKTAPSMRPQPLSCGNLDSRTRRSNRTNAFNEAATSQLRKRHSGVRRPAGL